jgi:hypothetical protein
MEIIHGLRGLTGTKYGGIHDELKVRAIAFSNGEDRAVIVQLDLDKDQAPTTQLPIISEKWNVPVENILYFGIHTHAAPMFSGRHELGNPDEYVLECTHKYEEIVFNAMYEAIDEAFGNMRPAKIGCGKADSYTNVVRVEDFWSFDENGNPAGVSCTQGSDAGAKVSHEIFVMRVNDMEDKPIAFLVNFPMHCVIMFLNKLAEDGNDLISGDVGGNISRLLEKRYPGAVAVWSSGAAGNVNPLPNSFGTYVDPETNKLKNFELVGCADEVLDYVVAQQFAVVMKAINNIKYYSDNGKIVGKIDWSTTPAYKMVPDPKTGRPTPTDEIGEEGFTIRMQLLRVGDVAFIGVGGELFNSYAEEIKEISPLKNTVVINHNCSLITNVGYILDDDAISRNYGLQPGRKTQIVPGYIGKSLNKIVCGFFDCK